MIFQSSNIFNVYIDRYDDAQTLLKKYSYEPADEKNLRVVLTDDHPFDINQYLLPFAIVVGICFVIMLVIVIYKCIQVFIFTYRIWVSRLMLFNRTRSPCSVKNS